MGEYVIKLPDVGEGVAEAELVEWNVAVGDVVREDAILASVMTDKAAVEIPSPVEGTVIWLGAEIGEQIAVGSPLVRLEVSGEGNVAAGSAPAAEKPVEKPAEPEAPAAEPAPPSKPPAAAPAPRATRPPASSGAPRREGDRPLASPAVRGRAREAGVDLRQVRGSGPAGRITHEDLDAFLEAGPAAAPGTGLRPDSSVTEVKVIGLRRRIAEKMALSKSRIAHITYVDEVDVTALEELRAQLNRQKQDGQPRLTILPFLMRAMVKAIAEQPAINAHFDDEAGVIHQYGGVHIGIAAQTPTGLVVPVVKHAEARDVWGCAAELNRLSDAAKAGAASRDELTGSTITITSLGAMGGLVTTPVINHPEVAIVGVNKIQVRPVWDGSQFVPRKMMNLSSSFDHRVVDGWDAAVFVQRIKTLLETPAMIFM
ncbi:dihydrolipoamide acetyltransferase component of pyruvate dehydrogenase complex [Thalassobaculum fulvum]|uniref:Dihydrolipoamide acetyltransferase component of pyruvate dehydrogenase complex n=1 Tax=Thalassobaculum fulvum TaxID=1633335 RepID=A0A918XXM2_9PROT|nr:dihydrolipoamide acetyltransferase family protein [Thalassobaculum fulvum]GHD62075.1 dihydrolipoamide acetyltransferase component of pyruvate dehydrogenase complex [Thalassobaculum fulvum]